MQIESIYVIRSIMRMTDVQIFAKLQKVLKCNTKQFSQTFDFLILTEFFREITRGKKFTDTVKSHLHAI